MNSHSPIRLHLGAIDDSLMDIVTTFRLSASAISELPEWIHSFVPNFDWGRVNQQKTNSAPFYGTNFLGTIKHPVQKIWAPRLSIDLAERGIVPQNLRIKIRGLKGDSVAYSLKLLWSHQRLEDSEDCSAKTARLKAIFDTLQMSYAWDVVGSEFVGIRRILLSFRGKSDTPPSYRRIIGIGDNQIVLNPNNSS